MLAVNVAVFIGVFLHKISLPPYVPYIHLLVDYHFGFTKRALIGAAVGLFTSKVPVWLVFALGGVIWLITLGLFVRLFRRTFGFTDETLPLFVFMAGSPFFLKNFMHTLGHFDIYGCAFAILLLLIPARSRCLCAARRGVLGRPRADPPHPSPDVCADHRRHRGAALLSCAGRDAPERHRRALPRSRSPARCSSPHSFTERWRCRSRNSSAICESRMADPSQTRLLSFAYIWYQPLAKEILDTWARLPSNILGVPVFALLIWLHTPLWRYFSRMIGALASDTHRRIVIAAMVIVSAGYLVMFAIVFDYSRWISNWAVCLFLILHAVKMLPASREACR